MVDEKDERFEERAAIMEYDGGLSRQEAERLAREAEYTREIQEEEDIREIQEEEGAREAQEECRIDPVEHCLKCEKMEMWQTAVGNWRCLHCDPPTTSRRLMGLASKLRKQADQRATPTPQRSS